METLKYEKLFWDGIMIDDSSTKRYMELQMEELKDALATQSEDTAAPKAEKKDHTKSPENAALAKMYEDAAEYEKDLEIFEEELKIVNANELKDIAQALSQRFPNEDRNYPQELKTILVIGWTHLVELQKAHAKEQLELIEKSEFSDIAEKLSTLWPEYEGNFEKEIRALLVKRWENLIAIKKEHIEEEHEEIETAGLKPNYVKRVYQQYHGIIE